MHQKLFFHLIIFFYAIFLPLYISGLEFLTESILLWPQKNSIEVVWFTSGKDKINKVYLNEGEFEYEAISEIMPDWSTPNHPQIWRHQATIKQLPQDQKINYYVCSGTITKGPFYLKPGPKNDEPVQLLLTSDLQCREYCSFALSEASKYVNSLDAVLCAGDIAPNTSAKYWLTHNCGSFPLLQGTAQCEVENIKFSGGALTQHIPIFPAFGNHDSIDGIEFPWSRYNQIFCPELKNTPPYYSVKFGNIYLIVLNVCRVHKEKYCYVSISKNSEQYKWLENELSKEECQNADLRMIMMHHHLYSLRCIGGSVCSFSNKEYRSKIPINTPKDQVQWLYPEFNLENILEPLFNKYGVDLVFNGHDHIWNHFINEEGTHYLSSSFAKPIIQNEDKHLTESHREIKGVIPNIVPHQLNGVNKPYLINRGSTFSILNTDTMTVDSFYCSIEKKVPKCVKFDSFNCKQHKKE